MEPFPPEPSAASENRQTECSHPNPIDEQIALLLRESRSLDPVSRVKREILESLKWLGEHPEVPHDDRLRHLESIHEIMKQEMDRVLAYKRLNSQLVIGTAVVYKGMRRATVSATYCPMHGNLHYVLTCEDGSKIHRVNRSTLEVIGTDVTEGDLENREMHRERKS